MEPEYPKAAFISSYIVHGLPEGVARVAMNLSGAGWGFCWMRTGDKVGVLWGEYDTEQDALRALEKEVFGTV